MSQITKRSSGGGSSGAINLISTLRANNSSEVDFTSQITPLYNNYLLLINNYVPEVDSTFCYIQVSTDGGATYFTSGYQSAGNFGNNSGSGGAFQGGGLCPGNASMTTIPHNFTVYLLDLTEANASIMPSFNYTGYIGQSGNTYGVAGGGYYNTEDSSPVNAIRVIQSSGLIVSGSFSLYGIVS